MGKFGFLAVRTVISHPSLVKWFEKLSHLWTPEPPEGGQ